MSRGKQKPAAYILYDKPNLPITLIEATGLSPTPERKLRAWRHDERLAPTHVQRRRRR